MPAPRQPSVGLLLPPVLISFAAFVLVVIALLAGTGPQRESLEPYHIIAVNLSNFGQDLVASATSSSTPKASPTSGGSFFDQISDAGHDLGSEISGEINNITNGIADDIIKELGISEWYSLHILTGCEGMFAPNASSPSSWYNLTNCTAQHAGGVRLNLSSILDHEVEVGPFKGNLNQVPIPDKVQNAINLVNDALRAIFVLYALASALSGLSFLFNAVVLILLRKKVSKPVVWAGMAVAGLAAFILLIGSAIITYVNNKGVPEINDAGKDVGISGIRGSKLISLSWISFALMLITSLYWGLALLKYTRRWVIIGDGFRGRSEKILP
ncbi:actin cortical patch SUR7/pH-response regulator pali [Nemania abortiva]|nr:actin cortical patch SUR7/pH-response regulator pali [Nemania abortiva]